MTRTTLAVLLAIGSASPALAQDQTQQPRPPSTAKPPATKAAAKPPMVRVWGQFDFNMMSASKSFDAVTGSSSIIGFGAGGDLTRLWRGVFARISFAGASASGSRVIVVDNVVVPLNIPADISLTAFTVGGGWRQRVSRRLMAYGGAGLVLVGYSEKSDFSGNEATDDSFTGTAIFGGVEMPLGKWFFVGGEAEYRSVPDAIGTEATSVARAYGESNLGGTILRVMFGVRK